MISNVREGALLDSERVTAKWPAVSEGNEMRKHEQRYLARLVRQTSERALGDTDAFPFEIESNKLTETL